MVTAILYIFFIAAAASIIYRVIKINRITWKYGLDLFSKTKGLTEKDRKLILRHFGWAIFTIAIFMVIAMLTFRITELVEGSEFSD